MGDDVGVHIGKVLPVLRQPQPLAQPLVFPGNGICLPGLIFDLGQLFLQPFVFGHQRFVFKHIAVKLLRLIGELTDAGADGGQNALDQHIRQAHTRQRADDRQHHGKQYGDDQDHPDPGGEKVSHWISSINSGASSLRICPRRHTGRPITL